MQSCIPCYCNFFFFYYQAASPMLMRQPQEQLAAAHKSGRANGAVAIDIPALDDEPPAHLRAQQPNGDMRHALADAGAPAAGGAPADVGRRAAALEREVAELRGRLAGADKRTAAAVAVQVCRAPKALTPQPMRMEARRAAAPEDRAARTARGRPPLLAGCLLQQPVHG